MTLEKLLWVSEIIERLLLCHSERSEESPHGVGEDAAEGFNQKALTGAGRESFLGCFAALSMTPHMHRVAHSGMKLEVVK
jgi:hypothetical protein